MVVENLSLTLKGPLAIGNVIIHLQGRKIRAVFRPSEMDSKLITKPIFCLRHTENEGLTALFSVHRGGMIDLLLDQVGFRGKEGK